MAEVAPIKQYLFMVFLWVGLNACISIEAGITSRYVRRLEASLDMPMDSDVFQVPSGYNAPQQFFRFISLKETMLVELLLSHGSRHRSLDPQLFCMAPTSISTSMKQQFDTKYFYKIGTGNATRKFSFSTPPRPGLDTPYTFGIIGDLGQTFDSNKTFQHYVRTKGQAVLYVGDLSYADNYPFHDNRRWDTWGRFTEKSTAYQPWIWTAGNHEIDFVPEIGERQPFKPYSHRYHVPYRFSNSTAPFWYSIKRASAYIIVLSSYSAYGKYTPQYTWLQEEFAKVDRKETPWLIVLMHSPWYNSNNYHYMEGESMRVQFESWFTEYKVDVVFAGHVHAYERSKRVSNVAYNIVNGECTPIFDPSSPVYITIGDGGNVEGLAANFTEPQPKYSAFREASFGHALLEIKNRTHVFYHWHRNQDGDDVVGDSQWFYNRYWYPQSEPTSAN